MGRLVSGIPPIWFILGGQRGGGWPPTPSRGDDLPWRHWPQPFLSVGTAAVVTHDRTVARLTIARTRQVTVTQVICGVDVSSTALDARIGPEGPFAHFGNSADGIEQLSAFCREHGVELVVMEATGGYEKQPFALLWERDVPAAIVNPRAVRDFAKAMGRLEKTDRIDAGVIAWFAQTKQVRPMPLARDVQSRLKALVTRLRQLTGHRVVHVQQRELVTEPFVLAGFDEILALLARQMRALEVEIASLISADPLWSKLEEAFRSIKGVADRTVARLMAELPEIGLISNKAIAKLVGVAPLADDSGKAQGKRSIRGGRSSVREILFVVADVARRYNPDLAAFRDRLLLKGKEKKVVRIALAHKLLIWLNAKARDARKAFALAA